MPHRQQTAWLSLLAIVVAFGPRFAIGAISPLAELVHDGLTITGYRRQS